MICQLVEDSRLINLKNRINVFSAPNFNQTELIEIAYSFRSNCAQPEEFAIKLGHKWMAGIGYLLSNHKKKNSMTQFAKMALKVRWFDLEQKLGF